ncbi:PP2C family protein-serine/threonine phosphatase [Fibrella forsythiae]|uniref:Serine/threonine-protein phosphatase n=1 Tax=Fibrella forsythiae TaxID=2817061 RepID=A0ABS3JCI4_9BACT|nr:protein phosphatase 2C domain-containing protein [Fibrella forsythiae]MBO0947723.1 serine/threonine-protein phosphatase [Fibrella forsythiae]
MTSTLPIFGQTDVGRSRHDNQDTYISQPLWSAQDALLVVIDGVGGYAGGAEAAALAKDSIVQYMATPTGDTLTMLREAVIHANNQIVRQRRQDPSLGRMCCVLTAAVADAATNKLLFVHVGDTRLYRFRHQQLDKLTHDHSLVGLREDANQLTEREAMRHPRRNEILRNVGSEAHRVDDPDFLESDETDFLPGDLLLLCSDGLTDMLTRAEITDILTQTTGADEQIAELIRQANDRGGQDNITVVLAQHPLPGPVSDKVTPERVRTRDRPTMLPANVPGPTREPAPKRTWKPWLLVLGMLVVVGLIQLERMNDPPQPASPVQTPPADTGSAAPSGLSPVRSDSSGTNNATTQPDSIRQKR